MVKTRGMQTTITDKTTTMTTESDNQEDEEVFHDSKEFEDRDPIFQEISLEIIHHQLALFKSEMVRSMSNMKEDIIIRITNEGSDLKKEIIDLKNELDNKSAEIVALREEVSSLQQTVDKQKKEFESARKELSKSSVKKSEFIEVEKGVVDLQQYIYKKE